MFQKFYYRNHI